MARRSSARSTVTVRLLAVVALSAVGFALAATAAGAATKHKLKLTAVYRPLVAPTASFTATGTIAGPPFGAGAIVRHVKLVGNTLSVKLTWFATNGSVSGTASETRTFNPDGSVSFSITKGRITSGRGAYRGATGKFSGTGKEPNLDSPVTAHLSGQITY